VSKVNWAALMRLGIVELRLRPEQFWALTPAELTLMAGTFGEAASLSRAGFTDLAASFPDGIKE